MVSQTTIKKLYAVSRNNCAFKNCTEPIYQAEFDSIVGQICHIRSKNKRGPRYEPSYPEEKIDDYENLILLCNKHHKIIDNKPDKFTIEVLTEIKKEHKLSGEPIEEPLNNLVVRLIEHMQKIIDSDNHKWDPASERAYYKARDYLINESEIFSQDKDEILKHFKILEEEGSKKTPHKLRVEISWKYIKRKAPHKVISLLSSVIKDIISRSS